MASGIHPWSGSLLASIVLPCAVVCRDLGVAPLLRDAGGRGEGGPELYKLKVDLTPDLRRPRERELHTFLIQVADVLGAVSVTFDVAHGLIPIVEAAGCFNNEVIRPIEVCSVRISWGIGVRLKWKFTSSDCRLPYHCHTDPRSSFRLRPCSGFGPWPSWDPCLANCIQEDL